jgi:hypothetical protein
MVKPTGWVVDMRYYIVEEDTGDLSDVIPEGVTCPQSGDLLRRHRGVGHGSPARGRRAHERALPAQSPPPLMSRRDHRGARPHVWLHRVAVPALRRPRHDPRLRGHAMESPRRRASAADGSSVDHAALTDSCLARLSDRRRVRSQEIMIRRGRAPRVAGVAVSDHRTLGGLTQFAISRTSAGR